MTELPRRVTSINMSAIPVNGVGGLGMIAIAVVIAIEYPEAHWLLARFPVAFLPPAPYISCPSPVRCSL